VHKPGAPLAVIQGQINRYSKAPGIKAASALEFTDIFYYSDKRFLGELGGIVVVRTHPQYGVIDAVLILKYQPFGRRRITLPAPLNQHSVVKRDICRFWHGFSP